MKGNFLLRAAIETCWAILPEKLEELVREVQMRAAAADDGAPLERAAASPELQRAGSTAIIPITGTIGQRPSWFNDTSTMEISAALRAAMSDRSVSSIVLDVNSPGGTVSGVPELGAEIRAAREDKRIWAIANTQAGSAAYWLASQASQLWVPPSGKVGSIGVFIMHQDRSKALEQFGVNVSLISAGKYKVEASPFGPLTPEARAALQADVDAYYAMFTREVARGRGVQDRTVRAGFGEGRMVMADQALQLGMVDHVGTMDEMLAKLAGRKQGSNIAAESKSAGEQATDEAREQQALRDLAAAIARNTGGSR